MQRLNDIIIKQVSLDTPLSKCRHLPTKVAMSLLTSTFFGFNNVIHLSHNVLYVVGYIQSDASP